MKAYQVAQVNPPDGTINFGIGQPQMSILPGDELRAATLEYWANPHPEALAYGYEPGPDNLRCALAEFLTAHSDDRTRGDDLFITGGASQALDLICALYTNPGDTVFVEEPTYFLALRIFENHQLNMVSIPMGVQGIEIDQLEEALKHHRPKFLYTIPTFHNPSGATQPAAVRERLVELSLAHDFLIVADEVYHLLDYFPDQGSTPPPALSSYIEQKSVISVNSFSKICAPGLRLGWLKTHSEHIDKFWRCALLDSGGGINPFASMPVGVMIESGRLAQYIQKIKEIYRRRIEVLDDALQRSSIGRLAEYQRPDGGYFFWLRFPDHFDMTSLRKIARDYQVGFQPGPNFSHRRGLSNYMRLSFAFYTDEEIIEGVRRLEAAVQAYSPSR